MSIGETDLTSQDDDNGGFFAEYSAWFSTSVPKETKVLWGKHFA